MPPPAPLSFDESALPPEVSEEVDPQKRLSLRGLLVPVLLSVGVLAAILYVTYEPGTFREMARDLNGGLLWLAFAAVGLRILLGGSRLRYISQGTVTLLGGIRGAVAWDFMSAVTPSAVGGAPLAAYFVAKDNDIPVGEATAILLFSMLMDQIWFAFSIPLILLATIYIDVFPPALGAVGAGTITAFFIGMMGWAVFFAYATLIRPEILERVATWIVGMKWLKRFEGRVRRELVQLRRQAAVLRGQPPRFFVFGFLWSAGVWLSRYATLLFVVLSVYPMLDAFTFFVRTGAMILTSMAVPTPGGSGGIEGLYLLFLAPLISEKWLVGPTIITWRIMEYHLFIAAGSVMTVFAVKRRFKRRGADRSADRNDEPAGRVDETPRPTDAAHARRPA
ncbi:MAG: lysylphosphatidylglycerol synthase transmembrane domain-containing protein [Rhodothermales bacterium]